MSTDDLSIDPSAVKSSGGRLADLAAQAKAQTSAYFASESTAAQGNPGFASGPALVHYANVLQQQMNGFIDDLAANGEKIVTAAQSVQTTDSDSATGFNREAAALNGLSKPATVGP